MKTANVQFPKDVLQCIKIGVNTQSKILDTLRCGSSTLAILLRKLVEEGVLESVRVGMHNEYMMRPESAYNDPFKLAKPTKSDKTFTLPPRRKHSMDDKRPIA